MLILANTVLLNYEDTYEMTYNCTIARLVIDSITFFLIVTSSTYLNIKKAIAEKGEYFKSLQNCNEVLFTLLFLAQFGLDAARFALLDTNFNQVQDSEEVFTLFTKNRLSNAYRVVNAFLILSGSLRVQNYAQIIRQMSFMIKMLQKVSLELVPFILLFIFALVMFGFVFACLDLPFGDDYKCIGLAKTDYNHTFADNSTVSDTSCSEFLEYL